MGRPPGSKNKPKAPPADAKPGHNSGEMSDEQRQALTVQHRKIYETKLKAKKDADADFKNACKKARADLGPQAIDDIKDMIAADTDEHYEERTRAELERKLKVARWMGLDVGFQADLFAESAPSLHDRAFNEGKRVGLDGGACQPPANYSPGSEGEQGWIEGWHQGQALLASNIKPTGAASGLIQTEEPDKPDVFDADDDAGASGNPWPDDAAVAARGEEAQAAETLPG